MLIAIITLSGISSYLTVPKEAFPEIVVPEIFVSTAYPGNSPANMEKLITRPLEKELNTISGIDEITSTSVQGFSAIDIKFNFDVTPTEALRKVKDAVDKAKADPDFPDLPADPSVMELNFSELMPVMNINLSGDYRLQDLKKYAEYLEDRIESLPQISKVDIQGISDLEVEIEVDHLRAEAMQVSFNDISGAISAENMTVSGGDLLVDGVRRSVQVEGDFTSIEELENVIIKSEEGHVHLRDVAEVSFVEKEKESYAREYSRPVVSLDVVKRAGENLLEASAAINAIIEEAKQDVLPKNLNVSITNDQSDMTQTQVEELQNSIIFGVLLVVGVLLFFLGLAECIVCGGGHPPVHVHELPHSQFAWRDVQHDGVCFPWCLALGMLVDNGIVVVENVYRLMDEGYSPLKRPNTEWERLRGPSLPRPQPPWRRFCHLALWPDSSGSS